MTVRWIQKAWWVDFYRRDGVRIRRRVGTNRRDAERIEALERTKDLHAKAGIFDDSRRLRDLVATYLEYSHVRKAASSIRLDTACLGRLTGTVPADIRIADVSPELIERYIRRRLKDDVSIRTVNLDIVMIKAMFNRAVDWGWLPQSPISRVKKLRGESGGRLRFLSRDECRALLAVAQGQLRYMLLTFLGTGLRRGEMVNLKWQDVDLARRIIRVGSDPESGFQTKSRKERFVPITDELHDTLTARRRESSGPYVFSTGTGTRWLNNLPREIQKLYEKAGIEDANIHTLRHTFASHFVMEGGDLPTLQKILGHSSITLTMRYAHLAPDHLMRSMKDLRFASPPVVLNAASSQSASG